MVDLDPHTTAVLRAPQGRPGNACAVLGPETTPTCSATSQEPSGIPSGSPGRWVAAVKAAHAVLDDVPVIRLHDLRHTHATILLGAGVPVKVVSERLGHASATVTLGVYAHVMPGMQREGADRLALLVYGQGSDGVVASPGLPRVWLTPDL